MLENLVWLFRKHQLRSEAAGGMPSPRLRLTVKRVLAYIPEESPVHSFNLERVLMAGWPGGVERRVFPAQGTTCPGSGGDSGSWWTQEVGIHGISLLKVRPDWQAGEFSRGKEAKAIMRKGFIHLVSFTYWEPLLSVVYLLGPGSQGGRGIGFWEKKSDSSW